MKAIAILHFTELLNNLGTPKCVVLSGVSLWPREFRLRFWLRHSPFQRQLH